MGGGWQSGLLTAGGEGVSTAKAAYTEDRAALRGGPRRVHERHGRLEAPAGERGPGQGEGEGRHEEGEGRHEEAVGTLDTNTCSPYYGEHMFGKVLIVAVMAALAVGLVARTSHGAARSGRTSSGLPTPSGRSPRAPMPAIRARACGSSSSGIIWPRTRCVRARSSSCRASRLPGCRSRRRRPSRRGRAVASRPTGTR